ncbi:MAG: hypothetical protein ACREDC_04655, partial [Bradyrhizobium sp.]
MLSLAPVIAGCSSASDLFSRDAQWFSRPSRLFVKNISVDAPPFTPDKPVTPDDLVSADGACPGMPAPASPAGANASMDAKAAPTASDSAAPGSAASGSLPLPTAGTIALGHTECEVVRAIGAPNNVNISSSPRGDRLAVVTWSQGPRPGIYTFTAGRLTSIAALPAPPTPPRAKKSRARKR